MKTYNLVAVALLAAIATILQISNNVIGIPTGFGMVVDLVGVPSLLALFVFGLEEALYVLSLTAIVITFVSPTSWIGASMKFGATLPMILVPAFLSVLAKTRRKRILLLATLISFFALVGASYPLKGIGIVEALFPIFFLLILTIFLSRITKARKERFKEPGFIAFAVLAAIAVRGVVMVVANYFYACPVFFKMSAEECMAFAPWYAIFGWNALQGAIEASIAWALAFEFNFAEKYGL